MYNFRGAPLVFRMTHPAILLANTTVVTGSVFQIRCDSTMIMTTHAQSILLIFVEGLVAMFTIFFELRMVGDQVTRIDHDIQWPRRNRTN